MVYRRAAQAFKESAKKAYRNKGRPRTTYTSKNVPVTPETAQSFITNSSTNDDLPTITAPSLADAKKTLGYHNINNILEKHGIHRSKRSIRRWAQTNTLPKELLHLREEIERSTIVENAGGTQQLAKKTGITPRRIQNWAQNKTKKTAQEITNYIAEDTVDNWFKHNNYRGATINIDVDFTIHSDNKDYTIQRKTKFTREENVIAIARQYTKDKITNNGKSGVQTLNKQLSEMYLHLDEGSTINNITINNINNIEIHYRK